MKQLQLPFWAAKSPEERANELLDAQVDMVGCSLIGESYLVNKIRENSHLRWFVWDGIEKVPKPPRNRRIYRIERSKGFIMNEEGWW